MSYDLSCNAFFLRSCAMPLNTLGWRHPRRLCFFSPENSKLCLLYAGYRIFRGYKELCNAAERLPDVTHVVFVVHGVGGIMDESTIGRNAAFLRLENPSEIVCTHLLGFIKRFRKFPRNFNRVIARDAVFEPCANISPHPPPLCSYMIHFKFHKFTVLFPKINSWTACKLYAAPAYYYAVSLSKMLDCML